jgi:hypothetical protein
VDDRVRPELSAFFSHGLKIKGQARRWFYKLTVVFTATLDMHHLPPPTFRRSRRVLVHFVARHIYCPT